MATFVNNRLIDTSASWGIKETLIGPYKNGWHHLCSAFETDANLKFRHRACRFGVGLSLLIPLINMLIYMLLRIFAPAPQGFLHASLEKEQQKDPSSVGIIQPLRKENSPEFINWWNQMLTAKNSKNKVEFNLLIEQGREHLNTIRELPPKRLYDCYFGGTEVDPIGWTTF